jgi:integrase/recombinase XerD
MPSSTVPSATTKLRALHEQFVTEQRYAARLAPATLASYRTSFALLCSLLPTICLEQLTPQTMAEFFRRLETRKRQVGHTERSGVTASTVATHRSKLGRFFSWLVAHGYLSGNPFTAIAYPRVTYESRQYLGKAEIERIFAALVLSARGTSRLQRSRNLALFATLLYTGVRRGELLGQRLSDVNLDRLELTIRAETSKARAGRVVPMNSALAQALEDYLVERRKRPLSSPQLFVSDSGAPLTFHGLRHLTRRLEARSGVRFHLHQFRHTFAVNFLNRSGDVAKLKQLLGHRDIRMTSGYLRSLPTTSMRSNIEALTLDTLL